MKLKLIAAVIAVLATASVGAIAEAAPNAKKPLTGTWSGKTSQDILITDPATGEDFENEWSVRITVTALKGRVANVFTTVRLVCPGPAVQDVRVKRDWRSGAGPKLTANGSFTVRLGGISLSGVLGANSSSGRFDVSRGGCSGKGTWRMKRRL